MYLNAPAGDYITGILWSVIASQDEGHMDNVEVEYRKKKKKNE